MNTNDIQKQPVCCVCFELVEIKADMYLTNILMNPYVSLVFIK